MTMQISSTLDALRGALLSAVLAVAAISAAPPAVAADDEIRFFRIGTGTTGGTYFPIGGIIANAISRPPGAPPCEQGGSCGVPGLIAVAQASSGSVENIESIRTGIAESGLTQADIAYWAFTGTGLYEDEGPMEELRAIGHLYNELIHIVVPAGSDIHSIADLRARRVSLAEEGSGTLIDAREVLLAHGLSEDDVQAYYLHPERASDAMLAGELDAFVFVGGVPLLAIEDLARRMPIRLLPFDGEAAQRLRRDLPFFTSAVFPENAYQGVLPVPTVAVGAMWVTSAAVDADLIHGITRALWHETTAALLAEGHPRGGAIQLDNALRGIPIPLHPGAAAYYEEVGLLRDDDSFEH